MIAEPRVWRAEFPPEPTGVRIVRDVDGDLWVRIGETVDGGMWSLHDARGGARSLWSDLMPYAPLTEVEK